MSQIEIDQIKQDNKSLFYCLVQIKNNVPIYAPEFKKTYLYQDAVDLIDKIKKRDYLKVGF